MDAIEQAVIEISRRVEHVCDDGDQLTGRINRLGREHAERLRLLDQVLDELKQRIAGQRQRFAVFMPTPEREHGHATQARLVAKGDQLQHQAGNGARLPAEASRSDGTAIGRQAAAQR